jgi:hypothetical protein
MLSKMAAKMSAKEFLASLRLSSFEPLLHAERVACPRCGASRKLYCYDCYEPVGLPPSSVPHVRLPLAVHIVKHPNELQSKSTAVHAKILAPDSVHIHSYPAMPEGLDPATTVVAFPSRDAVDAADLDVSNLQSIVFIDSTWFQAKGMVRVSKATPHC